ncbi:cupredoxin family copper-binding protein [Candidatus Saccharibacteria bacterium]|nr:cupredoxin family copper-binding protein [Candidatus Saccharibacteria bacterium]
MPTAKSQSTTGATQTATTNAVTIKDFAFSPAKITVKVGTKVTWTNQDSTPHTVTADSGSGPDSGTMNQGQTYSFTYDTVGSFPYHCNFHSNMTGTVEVTQ